MPPLAPDVAYQLLHDVTFTVPTWQGVLHNAQDPNGRVLSATLGTGPAHGQVVLNASGSFQYVPDVHFVGTDSFTFQVSDDKAAGGIATATLTVTDAAPGGPPPVMSAFTTGTHGEPRRRAPGERLRHGCRRAHGRPDRRAGARDRLRQC